MLRRLPILCGLCLATSLLFAFAESHLRPLLAQEDVSPASESTHGLRVESVSEAIPVGANPEDEAVRALLDKRVSVEFHEAALRDAIGQLATQTGVNFVMDYRVLGVERFDPAMPITMSLRDVRLRAVLSLLLEPQGLTCLVRNGVFLVSTPMDPERQLITRIYPVADLLVGTFGEQTQDDPGELIMLIADTVKSDTWEENGGVGKIRYFAPTISLVVCACDQVHLDLKALLAALRQSRKCATAMLREAGLTVTNTIATPTAAWQSRALLEESRRIAQSAK